MKKRLSFVTRSLAFTLLVTLIMGFGSIKQVSAAGPASSIIDFDQFEMPIISVNTVSGDAVTSNEEYVDAVISILNDQGEYELTDESTTIRLRGNSTLYTDKKNFKMKFEKKQNLLQIGEGKGKPWNLIANYYDGSLLRNLITYHFADLLTGISYSPNCRSVELFVNDQYQGVYLLCENVNVNEYRIAINEDPDEIEQNGYLIEMTRYLAENSFEVGTATYEIKSDLSESESVRMQQIDYISDFITLAYDALKSGKRCRIKKYIDIDSLVDIYIGNEIVKNVDAGWDSFYLYKDADGKLCFGPMWDFDLALGNANCVKGFDSWAGFNPYHVLNVNANSNPWFCHALSYKWFRTLVKKRWNKLHGKIRNLANTVITEAESNYQSYCRNFEIWDVLGRQVYIEPVQIAQLTTFKEHYMYLSNWIDNRTKWLTKYYNSRDFINGIFADESGNELSGNSNLVAMSSILALALSEEVQMTYELLPGPGVSMSIIDGGSVDWYTMICATGFMLDEGAEYVLSFDYKCSAERSIPFAVQQNHDPYTTYYMGDLNADSTIRHFEGSFIARESDTNCALVFSLGGSMFNNTVVTIDNMSLIKI